MAAIVRSVPRAVRLPRSGRRQSGNSLAVGGPLSGAGGMGAAHESRGDGRRPTATRALRSWLTGPIAVWTLVSLRQLRRTLATRTSRARLRGSSATCWWKCSAATRRHRGPGRKYLARACCADRTRAATAQEAGQDPRHTLWAARQRSGSATPLAGGHEHGGVAAVQATWDLETVTALFDITDHYVSCTSGASSRGLVEHVTRLQLPVVRPEPAAPDRAGRSQRARRAGDMNDSEVIAGPT